MDDLPDAVVELLSITGNDTCMECDSYNVEWASINLGIFVCESCSGRHRQLGVHTSRIQSLKLDTKIWNNSSTISDMKLKGNINAKYYFESRVPLYQVKPPIDIGPVVIEDWIRNKYEKQLFIDPNNANNIYKSNNNNNINDENKSNSLNFALHKMPCSPMYNQIKYIIPNEKDENKYQIKQQFILLHGRFLSRYNNPSSQKCEQIIDITKYKIYISVSDLDRPCILSIDKLQKTNNILTDKIRFQFEYYKDVKYWTELLRKSNLFYKDLGQKTFASKPNDTVNSLLACSIMDIDNNSIYKHLKYGNVKKQHKFSIGWDKKWWCINLRRKILIYFSKDPRTIKPNKKNPMFIEAQGGYYINEIIADIDNNGYRSGQQHCLLLYHFNKTIFIKFDNRWPLIQFWKELHLKGKDVKYIGIKPMYYEKALCQQNVDVQVMVLKKRNSNQKSNNNNNITMINANKDYSIGQSIQRHTLNTATATDISINSNNTQTMNIKVTSSTMQDDMDELHMNSTTFSVGSPPIPPSYDGPNTINGMGIGTAILNHEMLMNEQKMNINDINRKIFKKVVENNDNDNDNDNNRKSITDFNQNDLLHGPVTAKHQKVSSLRMLMDLHQQSNGTIQNNTNLSDDDDDDDDEPYDFDLEDDFNHIKHKKKNSSFDMYMNKNNKKLSNVSEDSFNDDFGVFDYDNDIDIDIQTSITSTYKKSSINQYDPDINHNNNNDNNNNNNNNNNNESPLKHLIRIPDNNNSIHMNDNKRKSPIDIKQSVSETVSDNDINETDNKIDDINDHIIGRLRNAIGSMEELQYLADNTPLLPDDDIDNNSQSNYSTLNPLHIQTSTINLHDITITDPPSDLIIKQLTNSEYNNNDINIISGDSNTNIIQPELTHQISNFSDGNLSEEEDVMYKDHRRGTVEQYAEKNKYKSRTYRNFAKSNNGSNNNKSRINPRHRKKINNENNNNNEDSKDDSKNGMLSKVKLPAPPPKRKKNGNELMRQYQLNATQIRKLNDADMMQQIMIQVGSMASFFVQPGNKLFVHLHGTEIAQTINETHNTSQMWECVEELLSQRIGMLQLCKHD